MATTRKKPTTKVRKPKTRPAAKKAPAKKAPAKKAPAKKAPAKKAPAKKAPVKKAPAKKAPGRVGGGIEPLFLVEQEGGRYDLCLSDNESPIDLFEEEGHSGNGYAWDSVARVTMGKLGIDEGTVDFDSEAGTFVAMSSSRDTLLALGGALASLLRDGDALREAIRAVPEEDWDD